MCISDLKHYTKLRKCEDHKVIVLYNVCPSVCVCACVLVSACAWAVMNCETHVKNEQLSLRNSKVK